MGYSVGVPCALGYAVRHPERVRGVIVGDYPARYLRLDLHWVERTLAEWSDQVNPVVIRGLQADSDDVPLWDALASLRCPVLAIRGRQPGALLNEEDAQRYRQMLPDVTIVEFEDSGHALWEPDLQRYLDTLREFATGLDRTV